MKSEELKMNRMKTEELLKIVEDQLKVKGSLGVKMGYLCSVDAGFSELLFGQFNKITTYGSYASKMYVLSFESDLKGLKKGMEILDKKSQPEQRKKQGVVKNPSVQMINRLDRLTEYVELMKELFSVEFLSEHPLSASSLSVQLEHLKDNFQPQTESPLGVFRLVEERDGKHVGLVISPMDLSIKVAFTTSEKNTFQNPLTSHYEDKFESFKFHEQSEKHLLQFVEKLGFDKYPMAFNNLQVFKIHFECLNVEGLPFDIFAKSGKTQIRFVNEIITILYVCLGTDIFSKGLMDRLTEYQVIELPEIPGLGTVKDVRLYEADRFFSDPFYDFSLRMGPKLMDDDDGNEFMVAAVQSSVFPYLSKDVLNKGWQHHPIVYEAGK